MLQRTNGRLLLALLVVTGLAGTVIDNTLTKKERKNAITLFKDGRTRILSAADGLSAAQLNYKPSADAWSITECLSHIVLTETELWKMLENGMKSAPQPELKDSVKMNDEQFMAAVADRSQKKTTSAALEPARASLPDAAAAIAAFKKIRSDHIRYVKTTTEDLRNHIIKVPGTYVDGYQVLLLVYGHADRHYQQIQEIKASPGFPKS